MRVDNRTEYSTRELKLVFHQVVRDLLKKRPSWKAGWKRYGGDYRVQVGNRRKDDFLSGHAYVTLEPLYTTDGDHVLSSYPKRSTTCT